MQAQPSPKPQVSGSSATATNSCDFIETLEYSRFIEFCDACRQYRYIGLCFGAPGIGKTLSAAQYSRRDEISGLSPWTVVSIDPPLDTVLYTPPVVNTPGRVDTDLRQARETLFGISARPLRAEAREVLDQLRRRDDAWRREYEDDPKFDGSRCPPFEPTYFQVFQRFCRNRAILLFFGLTARSWRAMRQTLNPVVAKVLKRLHYPLDVILLCVRWYSAYPLSLRQLEEMMAERGISVDHSTVHRWAIKLLPVLEKAFRRSKRRVGISWRMDETYIKVKGEWKYLYRAVDNAGDTVDFLLRAHRDKAAARSFFEHAIERNGAPEKVTIDKSGSNVAALEAMNAGPGKRIVVRQIKYLNNIVEQDHRAIKRRTRPMLGFKDFRCAHILLSGIELMHMIRKGQMKDGGEGQTPAQHFYSLAA